MKNQCLYGQNVVLPPCLLFFGLNISIGKNILMERRYIYSNLSMSILLFLFYIYFLLRKEGGKGVIFNCDRIKTMFKGGVFRGANRGYTWN